MSDAFDPNAQPAGPGSPHGLSTRGAVPAADLPQPNSSDGQGPDLSSGPPDQGPADSGNQPPQGEDTPWRSLPVNREPYIRRFGRRHHSEWGQPDYIIEGARRYPGVAPGPWMPQADEINRLIYQVGSQLMMNGSNPVAQLAGQMTNARGLYAQATLKGQKAQSDYQYEVYDQNRRILLDKQTDELKKYSGIYAVYGKDPEELRQHLVELANEFNDPELLKVLNNKGVQAAEDLLHTRDNLNKDIMASVAQADKHREAVADEELKRAKAQHEKSLGDAYKTFGYSGLDDPRLGGAGTDTSDAGTSDKTQASGETPTQTAEDEDWNKERDTPRDLTKMPDSGGTTDSAGAWIPPEAKDAAGNPAPKADLGAPSGIDASGAAPMALQPGQDGEFPAVGGQNIPTRGVATPIGESPPAAPAAPTTTAQAEPPPGVSASWLQSPPPPPAATNIRALPEPPQITAMARSRLNGGTMPPHLPPLMVTKVESVVADFHDKLDKILQDQSLNPVEGADPKSPAEIARRKKIFDAVAAVDGRMAQRMDQLLRGNEAPPSNWSQRGLPWQDILPLASKVDPTFNKSTYVNRAKIIASYTSGIDGRNVTSVGTAFQHLLDLRKAIQNRPGYLASQFGESWLYGQYAATPEEQAALGTLDNLVTTAATEYERALLGGKPGVTSINEAKATLDFRHVATPTLLANVDSKIQALQKRLGELERRYNTGVAGTGQPDKGMREVFDYYANQLAPNKLNEDDKAAPGRLNQLTSYGDKGGQDKPPPGATLHDAPPGAKPGPIRLKDGSRWMVTPDGKAYKLDQ